MQQEELKELANRYSYLRVGQSVRENHSNSFCSGSSKSLIISRENNGILVHCFRCGESGYVRDSSFQSGKVRTGDANQNNDELNSSVPSLETPRDTTFRVSEFSGEGIQWLESFELDKYSIQEYYIGYSPKEDRLVFPLYNKEGLSLFQTRKLSNKDIRPKWITKVNKSNPLYSYFKGNGDKDKVLLVEDIVSAIKLTTYINTYPILSTNLSTNKLLYLNTIFNNFYIWLDNDNVIVNKEARKLGNKLKLLGKEVTLITIKKDPKRVSYNDLDLIWN